jgi:hypothetical protein
MPYAGDAAATISADAGASSESPDASLSVDGSPGDASLPVCERPEPVVQALLERWNEVANAAGAPIDFRWSPCDQFPHPTFRGGTAEAYGQFASVLLQFFEQGDDFSFLSQDQLFDAALVYVFPSGMLGLNTSFKQLTAYFSSPNGFGDQSTVTRQALAGYLARMP